MAEKYISKFMNWKLAYKMVFIYVVAILVPTSILALGFWDINMRGLQKAYYETQVNTILAARENLSINLNQIAASSYYYQSSDAVLELLAERDLQISDSIYRYIKDVFPLNKAALINTYVKRIGLYGYYDYSLNMDFGLANISHLNKSDKFLQNVKISGGKWEMEIKNGNPMLCYYCYIYAGTYPYDRGVMVVEANLEKLAGNFYQQFDLDNEDYPESLKKAIQYIRRHYMEDISMQSISDELMLHPNYLSTLINRHLKINFSYVLDYVRLQKACGLLASVPDMTISEISYIVGYHNERRLYQAFSKRLNCTPGEFRKRYG